MGDRVDHRDVCLMPQYIQESGYTPVGVQHADPGVETPADHQNNACTTLPMGDQFLPAAQDAVSIYGHGTCIIFWRRSAE